MDDRNIIDLYWQRSERAITETDLKYGKYCRYISSSILDSDTEAEECVNDTYMQAWSVIPPNRPERLMAFLGKITRNISINRLLKNRAKKRYSSQNLIIDELSEIIPDPNANESTMMDDITIKDSINRFLSGLGYTNRIIFVRRYWYMSSISEISGDLGISQSNVKITLFRLRKQLKAHLNKEGIEI